MSEHFFGIFFSFSSFLVLTNAKCRCHIQMSWLVLPMCYATIVPLYVIDRLLTTDLDVNLLMNANKMWCESRFFIFDANAPWRRCKCNFHLWCKCPMQGWKCKVYPWWCRCTYLIVMHMSPCRDGDANVLRCKCLSMGTLRCRCPFVHAMMRMSA